MSVKKFKFVSPGIFLSEVDNSQLPASQQAVGPVIIGRTRMGPSMRPVTVSSPSEFVQIFGNPIAGGNTAGDAWRSGNLTGPTYAAYAAMAYLKANVGPITMVRLLGETNPSAPDSVPAALAGWELSGTSSTSIASNGAAYGLFVLPSGSAVTGTLGAILYCNQGALALTGTAVSSSVDGIAAEGAGVLFDSDDDSAQYTLSIYGDKDTAGSPARKIAFNFNRNSDLFIRKVLNTNPQLTNEGFVTTSNLKNGEQYYWLGESFETDVSEISGGIDTDTRAILVPLGSGSAEKDDYKFGFKAASTGYFFSQDLSTDWASYEPEDMTKLFRIVALDAGRWTQDNLKISIQSIKASTNTSDPYGSFNVLIRAASDRDNVIQIVEQFTNVNLNPNSENYIGRVIGDHYYDFDYDQKVLRQYGQFANNSKYIRVDVSPDVENGLLDARLLPFGCTGPLRFKSIALATAANATDGASVPTTAFIEGSGSVPLSIPPVGSVAAGAVYLGSGSSVVTSVQLDFPTQLLRLSASDGGIADPTDAYFGPMATTERNSSRKDGGWGDYMWRMPEGIQPSEDTLASIPTSSAVEYSWAVSLDDVIQSGSATSYWEKGARKLNYSLTAKSSSWEAILAAGYDKITAPFYGGFDGLDITEAEPFRDGVLSAGTQLDTANYAFNTVKRAIDTVKDPEFVECNIMTIPGVVNSSLTQHLVDTCEDRADALAIIDLQDVYKPFTDSTKNFELRNQTSISQCVTKLRTRGINSSYACTYYPWVQILDTISNRLLWAPPSVVTLGTLASSEAKSEVWFAPAGFNRGGLTEGAAGWPVTNVTRRLTSKDRDSLYEANINPIATFPSEGIVVFGQKTLQVTQSALDRINVRRLLIYIKKQISRISSRILFDQNTQVTWDRFLGEVRPFLTSVQSRLGLSEWKVILDDTTTTPDLVDQNIMYAKIFLKPARAIEFIAVDFVITRTGASFDD